MSWEDLADRDNVRKEKLIVPGATHIKFNGFGVIRIGRKYKDVGGIHGFENHMERKEDTPNANTELRGKNRILIGSPNVYKDSKEYLKDVFIRKNSVVGREILVTASKNFFTGISQTDMDKWVTENINFLQGKYGECLRYATIHFDETTPHIHCLIIPRLYNKRFKKWTLQNYKFFDGKAKFYELQDEYGNAMKQFNLSRGQKFSKAKHIEIRSFYKLLSEKVNENDIESLIAHSKNTTLLKLKIKAVEDTLELFQLTLKASQTERDKLVKENSKLLNEFKTLSKDTETYKEVIDTIAFSHKMSQASVKQVFEYVKENSQELER